jgi:O-antigen/teichoic acid export membrane protein
MGIPMALGFDRDTLCDGQKIRYFIYLYIPFFLFWVYPNLINVMIGKFLTLEDVAVFSVCYMLNNVAWVFLFPALDALFPFVSSVFLQEEAFEKGKKRLSLILWIVIHALLLWVIFLYFMGDGLLSFLYGKSYVGYRNILFLLSVSVYFESFRVVFDPMLKGTRYAKTLLFLEFAKIAGVVAISPAILLQGGLIYFCYFLICTSYIINLFKGFMVRRLFSMNLLKNYLYATILIILFHIFANY